MLIQDWPKACELREIAADVAEIVEIALSDSVVHDRFSGTAILTAKQVSDIGGVGYVARASGVVLDARRDHLFTEATTGLTVVTETGGDVLARFLVEGWRGTIAHRVEISSHERLRRLKIVDPSFLNWPALPVALADTIVPDFPLTNKSFNLSYAGNYL